VLAAEAVRTLRRRGRDAVRLADGFPEWRDAGLPVEAGLPSTSRAVRRS
jgi:rhodanese-related sulfurtransferase